MAGHHETPVSSEDADAVSVEDVPGELARLLRDLSRLRGRIAHSLGHYPLAPSEVDLLRMVNQYPGIAVGDAARRLAVRSSNLSATIRSLTAKGLLIRKNSPSDRRMWNLFPSALARANVGALDRRWEESLLESLRRLPAEQQRLVLQALPALTRVIEGVPVPDQP